MSVFTGLMDDLLDLMVQTFVIERVSPAPVDPNTNASTGPATRTPVVTQPCSLQEVRFKRGGTGDLSGADVAAPSFVCYTKMYTLPALLNGEHFEYRVDGAYYPLEKAIDVAGDHAQKQLQFGPPQGGR